MRQLHFHYGSFVIHCKKAEYSNSLKRFHLIALCARTQKKDVQGSVGANVGHLGAVPPLAVINAPPTTG